ncbi:MAG TPA: chemotaxis protein CheC [Kofleriaceae bacterium]|nr:chemotaxis protein CheC [Kofleriaceae bacterium]
MIHLGGPEQRDALAELVNIGMGQAGDSLARLFDTFIQLSIPRITLVEPRDVTRAIGTLIDEPGAVVAVRQAFSSRIRGEALAIYAAGGCDAIADLVTYPDVSGEELVLEISNVLIGACVGGLAAQFGLDLSFSPPSILGEHPSVEQLLDTGALPWQTALIAEVNFRVVGRAFRCHLLTFWPDDSIGILLGAVDAFLAAL